MDITYHTVNVDIRPAEREMIERELSRVGEVLRNFSRLDHRLEIERSPRKGGYGVSLHTVVSTRSLFATAWGTELRTAVESATDKVVRQARKHMAMLRKDERAGAATTRNSGDTAVDGRNAGSRDSGFQGRNDRGRYDRDWAGPTAADLEAIRDYEDFCDQIGHHAARLNKVLRREMRLDPRALAAGEGISVPDVVEDAITYVFEHFREKPQNLSPDRWLVRRGLILLDEALDRAHADSTDSDYVESPPEAQEDWEELMNLPVEDFRPLDDQVADDVQTSPEILRERRNAQRATARALGRLSTRQRTSLVLRHLEGYEVPEIAFVLNANDPQVEDWLDEAEVALQDALKNWRAI